MVDYTIMDNSLQDFGYEVKVGNGAKAREVRGRKVMFL